MIKNIFIRISKSISYRLSYKFYDIHRKLKWKPTIVSDQDTIRSIIDGHKSLARFGDGEIRLMEGENITFQDYDLNLSQKLREVIFSNNDKVCIAIPIGLADLKANNIKEQSFWYHHLYYNLSTWYKYLKRDRIYSNSQISRFYSTTDAFIDKDYKAKDIASKRIELLKKLWNNRECLFVEGEYSRLGVGNRCFDNARSIRRILCPSVNAFSHYNEILDSIKKNIHEGELVIIALGPTATVMAYDLSEIGIQSLDMGHVDIEYEWWRMKAVGKKGIRGKYSNEAVWGGSQKSFVEGELSKEEIEQYEREIIDRIVGDADCISSRERVK